MTTLESSIKFRLVEDRRTGMCAAGTTRRIARLPVKSVFLFATFSLTLTKRK